MAGTAVELDQAVVAPDEVLRDGEAIAVEIRIGVTDGRSSEVVDGGLEPGMQVITDLLAATP